MRIIKLLLLFSILLFACAEMFAQPQRYHRRPRPERPFREPKKVDPAMDSLFLSGIFDKGKTTIPYRYVDTGTDKQEKKMLVIYLHGRSASGSDNKHQLTRVGVKSLLDYLHDHQSEATLLVPQCPIGRYWNERLPDGTQMSTNLKALIDELLATGEYDAQKIYIFGDSMGGAGVWLMLNEYPSLFSAAMIAAAMPRDVAVSEICNTPVYVVVGSKDERVKKKKVNKFVDKVEKEGGSIRLDVISNATHPQTCDRAFTEERIEWVLSHQRR